MYSLAWSYQAFLRTGCHGRCNLVPCSLSLTPSPPRRSSHRARCPAARQRYPVSFPAGTDCCVFLWGLHWAWLLICHKRVKNHFCWSHFRSLQLFLKGANEILSWGYLAAELMLIPTFPGQLKQLWCGLQSAFFIVPNTEHLTLRRLSCLLTRALPTSLVGNVQIAAHRLSQDVASGVAQVLITSEHLQNSCRHGEELARRLGTAGDACNGGRWRLDQQSCAELLGSIHRRQILQYLSNSARIPQGKRKSWGVLDFSKVGKHISNKRSTLL